MRICRKVGLPRHPFWIPYKERNENMVSDKRNLFFLGVCWENFSSVYSNLPLSQDDLKYRVRSRRILIGWCLPRRPKEKKPHVISCPFTSTLKYTPITQRSACECWKFEKTWLSICVLKKLLINLSLRFANKMIEDNHVPEVLLTWVYYQARWVSMYPALNALSFLPSHRPAVKSKAKKEQTHKH